MSSRRTVAAVWGIVFVPAVAVMAAAGDLRLIEATRQRDEAGVRTLLKAGADVTVRQPDGATALHWAIHWDDRRTVDLLIGAGARVNAANDLGVTPLLLACSHGHQRVVETLVSAGADPNVALPSGETALMLCARTGQVGAVKALLTGGATVNARESVHGQTALMWAVANRHPAIVQALIAHGADIQARSAVTRVVMNLGGSRSGGGSREKNIGEVDQGGSTALLFAARSGDLESARLLVAAGANVNDLAPDGTSVLVRAAHSGRGPLAEFLLEKGADPGAAAAGYTALHAAVLRGDLIDRGPCCPATWVKQAPGSGLAVVTALLARGANPNVPFTKATPVRRWSHDFTLHVMWLGATPFWLAAKFLEVDMMRAMAASGADPHLTSQDGTTPLMVAAGLLYQRAGGTEAFVRDRRDFAAHNELPQEAALTIPQDEEQRALDAVTLIVELGGNVNATNAAGDTALHAAAAHGMQTVIQFLADKGARLDATNKSGATPLGLARRESMDLLRTLGATDRGTAEATERR